MKFVGTRYSGVMKALFVALGIFLMTGLAQISFSQPVPVDTPRDFAPNRYFSRQFRTRTSGKLMEVRSSFGNSGRIVQLWDYYVQNGFVPGTVQQWLLLPAGRIGGDMTYFIYNVEYDKYLDARTENGSVTVSTGDNSNYQRWFQFSFRYSDPPTVTYMNVETNSVLTRSGETNGSTFVMRTLTFADNQAFVPRTTPGWIDTDFPNGVSFQTFPSETISCAADLAYSINGATFGSFNLNLAGNVSSGVRRWNSWHPASGSFLTGISASQYGVIQERYSGFFLGSLGPQSPGTTIGATYPVYPIGEGRQSWYVIDSKINGEYYIINAEYGYALTANSPLGPGSGMSTELLGSAGARQRWRFDQP